MASEKETSVSVSDISDVESVSDVMDSWIELLNSKKESGGVLFLNVPTTFSRQNDISVEFKYIEHVTCTPGDYIGIYANHENDVAKPLCKKYVDVAADGKTGRVSFTSEEIPITVDGEQYYFMYVQPEKFVFGVSTLFLIEDDTDNDENATNADSSDEEFIVITSQQLKTENDELRNVLKQLEIKVKQKEAEIDTLKSYAEELNDKVEKDTSTIATLQNKIEDAVKIQTALAERNKELAFTLAEQCDDIRSRKLHERATTDEIKQFQEALEKSEGMLQAVEASKRLALDELTSLRAAHAAEVENLTNKKNAVIERLEKGTLNSAKIIEELALKLKQYEISSDKLNAEISELSGCDKLVADLKNEIAELQENLKQKQRELDNERKMLEKHLTDKEEALNDFELMKKDNLILNERNKTLKDYVTECEKRIMDYQRNVIHLRNKLMITQEKLDSLEATVAKTKRETESANEDLKKRLLDGAEIYKQQFLKIRKLEKQVANFKAGNVKIKKKGGLTCGKIQPDSFTTFSLDHQPQGLKFSSNAEKEHKLPEKCVIRFSDKKTPDDKKADKIIMIEESNGVKVMKFQSDPVKQTVDEKIQKSGIGTINDSDTGEYVSKRGLNLESKHTDCKYAELQSVPLLNDSKDVASNAEQFKNPFGYPLIGTYMQALESKAKQWKPCLKDFLLDDPANIPNVPLKPSAPAPPSCEDNFPCYNNFDNPIANVLKTVNACSSPMEASLPKFNPAAPMLFEERLALKDEGLCNFDKPIPKPMSFGHLKLSPATPMFEEHPVFKDEGLCNFEKPLPKPMSFGHPILSRYPLVTRPIYPDLPPALYPVLDETLLSYKPACHRKQELRVGDFNLKMETIDSHKPDNAGCTEPKHIKNDVPFNEDEIQSAQCPFCEEIFYTIIGDTILAASAHGYVSSLQQLWEHLEIAHQKTVCPICGALYDCKHSKEFKHHVDGHF